MKKFEDVTEPVTKPLRWSMALLLTAFLAGCGGGGGGQDPILGMGAGVGPPSVPLAAASCAGPGPLDLGSANNFAVLAGTAITLTNPQVITGDIGSPSITPAAVFPLVSPSTLVGTQHDTATGSLALIAAAVTDMQTAVGCAAARPCDVTYLPGAIDFAAQPQPLVAGHHCVTGAMSVGSSPLILTNPGVYIFDANNGAFTTAPTITVAFGGAANAANSAVFWVSRGAASNVSIGATNTFLGSILVGNAGDPGAITVGANTTLVPGRVLSTTAVTLNGTNTITRPTP